MSIPRIQCTIGPACNNIDTLVKMLDAGMKVARVNLSHGRAKDQKDKLDNFRKAIEIKKAEGLENADDTEIMFDIRGPKIRVKEIPGGELLLEDGGIVTLHCEDEFCESFSGCEKGQYNENTLPINYINLCRDVDYGIVILFDDGKIRLSVEELKNQDIICQVERGGIVKSHKSVNIPNVNLHMDYLDDNDTEDIIWCAKNDVDYIAASFVRRKSDIKLIRELLDENGGQNVKIIAKIENKEAISHLDDICNVADQVLVARGDLGVEVGYEKVPAVQKRIINRCNDHDKAVIVATQFLDSMIENRVPTRAEVSDIANAVYDGATDLLVTGETAEGKHPVEVVKEMSKIIHQAYKDKTNMARDFCK